MISIGKYTAAVVLERMKRPALEEQQHALREQFAAPVVKSTVIY